MSLTDALLLDPYRHPQDVWLAVRTDGIKGSGTESDPFNAASLSTPEINITSLTASGSTATATILAGHGLENGDWITVSGVECFGYSDLNKRYGGTFQIKSVTATTFQYDLVNATRSSPAPGAAIKCWLEREPFDAIMRDLPATGKITVHLGPGVFETKGHSEGIGRLDGGLSGSWQPKRTATIPPQVYNQRLNLRGAGIGITTLKVVGADITEGKYMAIGTDGNQFVEGFEASDFTVDCNIANQPNKEVVIGAIGLTGKHIHIRRVRAINFGSRAKMYLENFVFYAGGCHPDILLYYPEAATVDCLFEECVAEFPDPNASHNSSILCTGGGGERPSDGNTLVAKSQACIIRNCYVNAEHVYGPLTPVAGLRWDTVDGECVATVTTKVPHRHTFPGNVVVRGALEHLFNGVFAIDSIPSGTDTVLTYKPGSSPGGSGEAVLGEMTIGGGISSLPVPIATTGGITLKGYDPITNTFTYQLLTHIPHLRTTNNNVVFSFTHGSFPVTNYDPSKPCKLEFTADHELDLDLVVRFVGFTHIAMTADLVEGNRIFHCAFGGPYQDTYSTIETIVRDNYYFDVAMGPYKNLLGVSSTNEPNHLIAPLDYDDEAEVEDFLALYSMQIYQDSVAIATSEFPHGFTALIDQVIITGATGTDGVHYNTQYPYPIILEVFSAHSFSFQLNNIVTLNSQVPLPPSGGYFTYNTLPVNSLEVQAQRRLAAMDYYTDSSDGFTYAVATSKFSTGHGFLAGDLVYISKASDPLYNGPQSITALGDEFGGNLACCFQYRLSAVPQRKTDISDPNFCSGYFGRVWWTRRSIIENNIIELSNQQRNTGWGPPTGISLYGGVFYDQSRNVLAFRFPEVVIRDNIIRNVYGINASNYSRAIYLLGVGARPASDLSGCLVESNIVGNGAALLQITQDACRDFVTFRNTLPNGAIVQSEPRLPDRELELRRMIEETDIMSLIQK